MASNEVDAQHENALKLPVNEAGKEEYEIRKEELQKTRMNNQKAAASAVTRKRKAIDQLAQEGAENIHRKSSL